MNVCVDVHICAIVMLIFYLGYFLSMCDDALIVKLLFGVQDKFIVYK